MAVKSEEQLAVEWAEACVAECERLDAHYAACELNLQRKEDEVDRRIEKKLADADAAVQAKLSQVERMKDVFVDFGEEVT